LVHSTGQEAAVDYQDLSGDERGRIGNQVDRTPASSSIWPKRFIGVRIFNSRPRSVCRISSAFNAVGNMPGAIAFTQMLKGASSMARVLVSAPTPLC